MMIYCARITAIGLFVADGLTDKMLITFDSNGPKLHDLHGNLVIEEGRP